MFADDGCMHRAGIDLELFAEDVAQTFCVEKCAGANNTRGREARLFLDDVSENIDGIGCDDNDAVEALGHKFGDATAHDHCIAGKHVETRTLKRAWRAYGHDNDSAGCCVLVGACSDGDGTAEGHSLLEI